MADTLDGKIEKIEKISKGAKPSPIDLATDTEQRLAPNKDHFDSLMLDNSPTTESRRVDSTKNSLMDEVSNVSRRADLIRRASPQELVAQAQEVVKQIDELKAKLNTPNLELKSSVQDLLKNKLSHVDENLKIALSKAGVEYQTPQASTVSKNPIERFLGFLTDGQHKLENLASEVDRMHLNRQEIAPATMLAVQIKVGFVQQELEFFSNLLNQALSSTKTIMNVQV